MLQRKRPAEDRTLADILALLDACLGSQTAAYASVPITSGRRLHRFMQDLHRAGASFDLAACADFRQHVIAPNEREAAAFAQSLRRNVGMPVIDPSRFLPPPRWTQKHFTSLWKAVLQEYCKLAAFANGWEFSAGCTAEFVIATSANIRAIDATGKVLTRSRGIRLIEDAIRQLTADGLDPTLLRGRIDQLHKRMFIVPSRLPAATSAQRLLQCRTILDCLTIKRSCVLVLPNAAKHAKAPKRRQRGGTSALEPSPATSTFASLQALHRKPWDITIDVAMFEPNWARHRIVSFWADVIAQSVHTIVVPSVPDQAMTKLVDIGRASGARVVELGTRRIWPRSAGTGTSHQVSRTRSTVKGELC
jgi:hypothetical protein